MKRWTNILPNVVGISLVVGGCILTLGQCCLVFAPWLGTRPFWPGLDMPPGGAAQRASEMVHGKALAFVLIADLMLNPVIIVTGIAILKRWRFSVYVGVVWFVGKLVTALLRAGIASSVLEDQLMAVDNANKAKRVEGLGEIGIVFITSGRIMVLSVILASIQLVAIATRIWNR